MQGIYMIKNVVDNKCYIGQSSVIENRWYNHIHNLKHNKHHNCRLQEAWNLFGEENFIFEVLQECDDEDERNRLEIEYTNKYNACNKDFGYNITLGKVGGSVSEDTKHRIGIKHRAMKSNLTIEDARRIKTLLYCGIDRKEILKEYDISRKVLQNIVIEKAFDYILPECNDFIHYQKERYMTERNKRILKMYDSGMSITEIVNSTIYSTSVVEKCVYANRPVERNYNIRKLTPEQEKQVIDYWNSGLSYTEISKHFDCSSTSIACVVTRYEKKLG